MLLRLLPLVALVALIDAGSVNVCRSLGDCGSCADSYIHVFGFKENCRWCVETQTCGGPLACPMGKAVVQRDPYRCPKKYVPLKGRRYTDALGRSLFAVAVSLRADNTTECLHNSRPDISYVKKFTVECDSSGNICSSILAVSEEAKAIYVAYKGSSLDKQMLTEFVHSLAAQLGAWEKIEGDAGVITYFYTAWQRMFIEGGMKEELLALKKKHPGYRVWVTGHSLGGSLASITALHLAAKNIVDRQHLRLVTFGEPRTGNVAFAKAIEKHIDFRYRVVKRNDFVTNVPASIDPNAIMVTGSVYDRQPLFYRHLVHYNNNMDRNDAFKVCELSDDHGCRNLGAAIDINDHQSYFGISQDEYTKQKCRRQLLQ